MSAGRRCLACDGSGCEEGSRCGGYDLDPARPAGDPSDLAGDTPLPSPGLLGEFSPWTDV